MPGPVYEVKITSLGGTPVFVVAAADIRFMKVFGALWQNQMWYYPAFLPAAEVVLKDMRALKLPVVFSSAAQQAVTTLQQLRKQHEAQALPNGFTFKTKPYQHQIDGLVHLLYYWRAALFYACGLGKTKIVIDWQRAVRCWTLVVCPKIVVSVWARELQVHGIEQEFCIIDAETLVEREQQLLKTSGYQGVVLSYDTLVRFPEQIAKLPYTAMVADESHYIKSHEATRTLTMLELSQKAARRVIMSGTPSMGDPRDLWSQLRFLSPAYAAEEFWKFKQIYCVTAKSNKHIVVGYKNLDGLHARTSLVALRRTKEACLDLPKQVVIDRTVQLYGRARTLYRELTLSTEYQELLAQIQTQLLIGAGRLLDIPHVATLLNKLLQIAAGFVYVRSEAEARACDDCEHLHTCVQDSIKPHTSRCVKHPSPSPRLVEFFPENAKLDALRELLEEILEDSTNKVIIWGQYAAELDLIEKLLNDQHLGHVRVDGSTGGGTAALAEKFNTDLTCRVYLGQVSTGVGITLNAANYMVYYTLPWKLGDYEQSKDRNHRLGQERDTTIFRLIAAGTIDEAVLRALRTKHDVSEALIAAITCPACEHATSCLVRDIMPFDDECVYPRGLARPIAKASPLT
jgi:SNF2 family DNA or RNA helicase